MGLIQFSQRRGNRLNETTRLKPGIEAFSQPSAYGGYTLENGILRRSVPGAGVAGWTGNSVNAVAWRPTSWTIAGSGGASTDSLAIGCMFSATSNSDGTLLGLGVSTNVTGGYFQIGIVGGFLNSSADDAANVSGANYSASWSYADGRVHCAIAVIQSHPTGQRLRLFVDGRQDGGGGISSWNATTYNRFAVCGMRRSASSSFGHASHSVYGAFAFKPKADLDFAYLSSLGWDAFYEPRRTLVPITAAGGGVVGASSSQIDLAAGSSGAVLVAGASSQPLVFGGASSGAVAIAGASSQAVNLTGSATGTTVNAVTGASAATIDLGASAAGTVAVAGASSVQIVMAGTSTGTTTNSVTGASDQTLGFSGSSAGLVSVAGASAGQIDLSAAATGKANVVGQSSVSIDLYAAGSGINGDGSTLSGGILVRPSRRRYVAQDGDRLLVFETRAAAEAAQAKIDEARQVASVEAAKVISKAQARKAKARRADAARQAVQALAVQPVAVESLREIQASVPANTHEAAQIEAARAAADLHAVYAVWQAIQEDEQDAADALEASAKFDQAIIGQLVQTLGALRAALSTH